MSKMFVVVMGILFCTIFFLLGAILNTKYDTIEETSHNHYGLVHTGEPYEGFQSYPYKNIIIKGK